MVILYTIVHCSNWKGFVNLIHLQHVGALADIQFHTLA